MAKRVQTNDDENDSGGGKLPSAGDLDKFLKSFGRLKSSMSTLQGEMSEVMAKAEATRNIHRKAAKLVYTLGRMDPTKLAEFLRHFDTYREYAELDAKAGADLLEGEPKKRKRKPLPANVVEFDAVEEGAA